MKLEVEPLRLEGVRLIRSARIADHRGYFAETYVRCDFVAAEIDTNFTQDNQSRSTAKGTIRGLHFQSPPYTQTKLVRVLRGAIFDVVVDLRRSSATYGQHVAVELSEEGDEQLFVPRGFAHGFCSLRPDTEVFYKMDEVYSQKHALGVRWNDPALDIPWPVAEGEAVLSDADRTWPLLRDLPAYFD
jgi:dTDP-4-dehydrorhamnose 3,5-epimerase